MNKYKNNVTSKLPIFIMIIFFVMLDQILKIKAETILSNYKTIPIIPSVLHFTYVQNYGAAFGILQNNKIFLIGVTSIILMGILIFLTVKDINNKFILWPLLLISAGGIGNLIDRIFNGYVIDYIDFRLINFAVFNLADSYVCIGIFLIGFYLLIIEPKNKGKNNV